MNSCFPAPHKVHSNLSRAWGLSYRYLFVFFIFKKKEKKLFAFLSLPGLDFDMLIDDGEYLVYLLFFLHSSTSVY